MAFIRAVRGTMSVINPCIAGISNELTTPPMATRRKIGHGLETPSIATRAIARIAAALINAVTCNTLFRGNLSETAPPIGAAIRLGALRIPNVAAESRTELVSTSTSQPTAIRSAHVPKAMRLAAIQTVR